MEYQFLSSLLEDSSISPLLLSILSPNRLLSALRPTLESIRTREIVFNHLSRLICDSSPFARPFMFGSVPLRSFLPDGDIDIGALIGPKHVPEFFSMIKLILENENNEYVKFCQRNENNNLIQQSILLNSSNHKNTGNINMGNINNNTSGNMSINNNSISSHYLYHHHHHHSSSVSSNSSSIFNGFDTESQDSSPALSPIPSPIPIHLPQQERKSPIQPNGSIINNSSSSSSSSLPISSSNSPAPLINSPAFPFPIRSVNFISGAEVKIVKCLVGNLLVDISSNTTSALATVCYLEEIDQYIDKQLNTHHLFKESILLCKAWTCYEARILASHHALLSTYALETLVLQILNRFYKVATTPLLVLYQFLSFYSQFPFENYCISVRGPIPVSFYSDSYNKSISANLESNHHNPHNYNNNQFNPPIYSHPCYSSLDSSSLNTNNSTSSNNPPPLLSNEFLNHLENKYSIRKPYRKQFGLKYLNVCDPLDESNNLGRSVNYSNYLRIRHAFQRGSQILESIFKESQEMCRELIMEWENKKKSKLYRKKSNNSINTMTSNINGNNNNGNNSSITNSNNNNPLNNEVNSTTLQMPLLSEIEYDEEEFDIEQFHSPAKFYSLIHSYPAVQPSWISKTQVKSIRRLWLRLEDFFKDTWKRFRSGNRPDVALLAILPPQENFPGQSNNSALNNHGSVTTESQTPQSQSRSSSISIPLSANRTSPVPRSASVPVSCTGSSTNSPVVMAANSNSTPPLPYSLDLLPASASATHIRPPQIFTSNPAAAHPLVSITPIMDSSPLSSAATPRSAASFPLLSSSYSDDPLYCDLTELSNRFEYLRSQWYNYQNQMVRDASCNGLINHSSHDSMGNFQLLPSSYYNYSNNNNINTAGILPFHRVMPTIHYIPTPAPMPMQTIQQVPVQMQAATSEIVRINPHGRSLIHGTRENAKRTNSNQVNNNNQNTHTSNHNHNHSNTNPHTNNASQQQKNRNSKPQPQPQKSSKIIPPANNNKTVSIPQNQHQSQNPSQASSQHPSQNQKPSIVVEQKSQADVKPSIPVEIPIPVAVPPPAVIESFIAAPAVATNNIPIESVIPSSAIPLQQTPAIPVVVKSTNSTKPKIPLSDPRPKIISLEIPIVNSVPLFPLPPLSAGLDPDSEQGKEYLSNYIKKRLKRLRQREEKLASENQTGKQLINGNNNNQNNNSNNNNNNKNNHSNNSYNSITNPVMNVGSAARPIPVHTAAAINSSNSSSLPPQPSPPQSLTKTDIITHIKDIINGSVKRLPGSRINVLPKELPAAHPINRHKNTQQQRSSNHIAQLIQSFIRGPEPPPLPTGTNEIIHIRPISNESTTAAAAATAVKSSTNNQNNNKKNALSQSSKNSNKSANSTTNNNNSNQNQSNKKANSNSNNNKANNNNNNNHKSATNNSSHSNSSKSSSILVDDPPHAWPALSNHSNGKIPIPTASTLSLNNSLSYAQNVAKTLNSNQNNANQGNLKAKPIENGIKADLKSHSIATHHSNGIIPHHQPASSTTTIIVEKSIANEIKGQELMNGPTTSAPSSSSSTPSSTPTKPQRQYNPMKQNILPPSPIKPFITIPMNFDEKKEFSTTNNSIHPRQAWSIPSSSLINSLTVTNTNNNNNNNTTNSVNR